MGRLINKESKIPEFISKIDKTPDCWHWKGRIDKFGYGWFSYKRSIGAHRFAYMIWKGDIPKKMDIDHLCRNRGCVNPAHLEVVTRSENLLRGDTWQAKSAAKTHCFRGHELKGDNLLPWSLINKKQRHCKICFNIWRRENYRKKHPNVIRLSNKSCY